LSKETKEMAVAVSAIRRPYQRAYDAGKKTLQESGALDPAHDAANIRMTIDANRNTFAPPRRLLSDIAELLEIEEDSGTA
jgi:hypothetical protein